jgi:hypothetical protein
MIFKKLVFSAALVVCGSVLNSQELKLIEPAPVEPVKYAASILPGGAVKVELGRNTYYIDGMFSLIPDWAKLEKAKAAGFTEFKTTDDAVTAKTATFEFSRKLVRHAECVEIIDSFKNLSSENLPLIYRNQLNLGKVKEYRLSGYKIYTKSGKNSDSINCTTICMPENGGSIGMLALSDVFRVHFKAFAAKGIYGIADNNLVIVPGGVQEMRFAVFPSEKDDYYAQINAMRRFLGVNYVIESGFTFTSPRGKNVKAIDPAYSRIGRDSSVEEIAAFIKNKSAKYICSGSASDVGEMMHGSAWMNTRKPEVHNAFFAKLDQAAPGCIKMHYFHCYLDQQGKMDNLYGKQASLMPNGKQADYRNPTLPLFNPVEGSDWAKLQEKRLDILIDTYKVEGIFWDEFPSSCADYHYGEPWDKVTGDIDLKTHKIQTLKSSIALITLSWRVKMVEMLADKHKFLIANGGGAYTETMMKIFIKNKFLAFMETGSVSNLLRSQLSTPIGLGDHISERSEKDCYNCMVKFLDYGSVYFWYHEQVMPITHETLTKYMFPITPVELHEGYIIGKERIITNRSGWFGFGGSENAELHFFNKDGFEVKRDAEIKTENGKKYYKVMLSENESCAIVKK